MTDSSADVTPFTTVDLFAGAGGLSLGFEMSGFSPLSANDLDGAAESTFRANFPETPFLCKPVQELSGRELLDASGVMPGDVDVLLGGPPCQAFSVYNHQRSFADSRSGLFREYLRLVDEVQPRVVVMENVVGMTSLGGGRAVEEMHQSLESLGYSVEHRILKAEEFGVPQERRRVFFIGSSSGPVQWPEATHGACDDLLASHLPRYVSVWDAIGDLPKREAGEGDDSLARYTRKARTEYQERSRREREGVLNHAAPRLTEVNRKRMEHIPPGGSWRDLPHSMLPAGMKKAKRSDHTKRYGRLAKKGRFSTILTKADPHWGAFIHPEENRTLTVRECARAQSFPDRFCFLGSRVDQYRQVGNAVPPLLASAVADAVRASLGAVAPRKRRTGRGVRVGA